MNWVGGRDHFAGDSIGQPIGSPILRATGRWVGSQCFVGGTRVAALFSIVKSIWRKRQQRLAQFLPGLESSFKFIIVAMDTVGCITKYSGLRKNVTYNSKIEYSGWNLQS